MNAPIDHSRRRFLGIQSAPSAKPAPIRPPWTSALSLGEHCTHCGDCLTACPEHILFADADGLPQVDFGRGACTFCGDCAAICAVPVFDRALSPAWRVGATISDQCLPKRGILCESCRDVCLDGAIHFARAAGRAPVPVISPADCTGCGACVSVCPAQAISAARVVEEFADA